VRLTKGNSPVIDGIFLVVEDSPWAHLAENRHQGLRGKVVAASGTLRRRHAAPGEQAPRERYFDYLSDLTALEIIDAA
jgi:hypothetical protein